MLLFNKTLASNQRVLPVGLTLLHLIGLWGNRRERYRFGLLQSCIVVALIGPKAILGSGQVGFDSMARNLAEMIFLAENCISIVIFVYRRKSFEQLIKVLERFLHRDWPLPLRQEIELFNRRMHIFGLLYVVYICFMLIMYLSAPIVSTIVKMCFMDKAERGDFLLVMEVQFYWLDIRRNILHYTIYMIFCCPASACSAYQSTIKGAVFLVIIQYGSKLFDLVAKRIAAMEQLVNPNERRDELRKIIELHNLALKYLEHLETTVSLILINQTMNCILIWCLLMIYISTNFGPNAANVILLFVVLFGEMVVYCINGTLLSDKASKVVDAMYGYPWYQESVEMQKGAILVIQRAQRKSGITAAKFYFVNVARLGSMMQATYSYYLILKDRF
ncbi:odorant receptor 63a-like [Topomyia yanbarensis]|uniref:odorant receptor 63a-like n=1 Tax=Topomyia yanbarensis TaxID=2498891 RepID=UPI00273C2061|nr:odorant receptor 63a-like [Topomyia yanbarensis]